MALQGVVCGLTNSRIQHSYKPLNTVDVEMWKIMFFLINLKGGQYSWEIKSIWVIYIKTR